MEGTVNNNKRPQTPIDEKDQGTFDYEKGSPKYHMPAEVPKAKQAIEEPDLLRAPRKIVSARPVGDFQMHVPDGGPPGALKTQKEQLIAKAQELKDKLLLRKSEEEKEKEAKEVEFIPEELISPLKFLNELKMPIFIISATIILLGLIYSILVAEGIRKQSAIKRLDQDIQQLDYKITNYQKIVKDARDLQSSFSIIKLKLDDHIYWTKFFKVLEENTLPSVYYLGVTGDIGGKFVFSMVTKNYEDIAKQLVVFQNLTQYVDSVSFSSAAAEVGTDNVILGIASDLAVNFNANVFKLKEAEATTSATTRTRQ